jgi:mono/diheme cytochrome c family protein
LSTPAILSTLGTAAGALAAFALLSCATGKGSKTSAPTGQQLYEVSCSGCHGLNARGNGPVAPIIKVPVPDLTLLAARRGGVFPADEVYRIIDGQADLRAHGPRHMPVWGYEYFGDDPDDQVAHARATEKIERLVSYLRSIQRVE